MFTFIDIDSPISSCLTSIMMNIDEEYAVTFSRIHLPSSNTIRRLTASIITDSTEQFLLKGRTVKDNRVNFYRQTLFIPTISQGLAFQIYEITEQGNLVLLKSFIIGAEQLSSVSKRAAMFHTTDEQYEFVWECGTFNSADSQMQNQQTDQEYSQLLDLSEMDTQLQDLTMGFQSSLSNSRQQSVTSDFRGSFSTDYTVAPVYIGQRNWRMKENFEMNIEPQPRLMKNEQNGGGVGLRRKCNIKSHIYSQLVSGISQFFSGGKP